MDFNLDQDHYFLYALARTIKPSVIVETGVFHGSYTASFLKGISENYKDGSADGRLISIDLPAYETIPDATHTIPVLTHLPAGHEPGWIIPDHLKDRWQLHLGDSMDILPSIVKKEKNISLFFHDSLHTYAHMEFEFETVYPVLKAGDYMMTHDVHWNRSFPNFVKKHGQKEFVFHGFGIFRKQNRAAG